MEAVFDISVYDNYLFYIMNLSRINSMILDVEHDPLRK